MKILAIATPLDHSGRIDELMHAACAAAPEGAADIHLLLTGEHAANDGMCAAGARVYRLPNPMSGAISPDALLDIAQRACEILDPALLLLSADTLGLQLAPRLAVRTQAAYVSGCCGFERTASGRLDFVRPIYGGRALEVLESTAALTIATIKPKSFADSARRDYTANSTVETLAITWPSPSSAITRMASDTPHGREGPDLENARVIVSGGRGLGNAGGYAELRRLAHVLDGAIGASRAAVDAGWIAASSQVGQTGTSVAPELYIAVGISGAVQHIAGMSASRNIIAINTDEEAPIFGFANVGVVADYRVIIPALISELAKKTA